jgi:hypothetical protein
MPTEREREYFAMGYRDGFKDGLRSGTAKPDDRLTGQKLRATYGLGEYKQPKRKLSAWNKFVKANSKKPRFRLRSGKLNLKKLGVAFRKTPAGKKKRR